jgi:ribonucleoside-diphosphate reductase alpha chain
MDGRLFLPNSPCLMNAGTKNPQLSACFVLPIEDSIKSIFDTLGKMANIQQSGGGTGFNFSAIRGEGSLVKSTGGIASGPLSFISIYNEATNVVKQGGKRRGANMAILNHDHPDIMKFIRAKLQEGQFSNFNFSVGNRAEVYELREESPILVAMADSAWKIGEPGNINLDLLGEGINATNPCVVGDSIVWTQIPGQFGWTPIKIKNLVGKELKVHCFNGEKFVNVKASNFRKTRKNADVYRIILTYDEQSVPENDLEIILTLDHRVMLSSGEYLEAGKLEPDMKIKSPYRTDPRVVSIEYYGKEDVYDCEVPGINNFVCNGIVIHNCGEQPLRPYESCVLGSINLGKMVHENNEDINLELLDDTIRIGTRLLNRVIDKQSYPLSEIETATKKSRKIGLGVMGFADMLYRMNLQYDSEEALIVAGKAASYLTQRARYWSNQYDFNNEKVTTIAPTGSIANIAGCSFGIEPYFSRKFKKLMNDEYHDFERPENVRVASEIHWKYHVRMLATWQGEIDNAVSKTINMPNRSTKEDVLRAFLMAYDLGCKGLTIYRDGSRKLEAVVTKKKGRPQVLTGRTHKIETMCGTNYIVINTHDGKMFEVFSMYGKSGGCASAGNEAIGRLASLLLRSGAEPEHIVSTLKGIRCSAGLVGQAKSCADSVARAIEEELEYMDQDYVKQNGEVIGQPTCECGGLFIMQEGCMICEDCGQSKCG